MWAIINKKEDFNVVHTHPNCYLSSAYYVKASKNCGDLLLKIQILQKDMLIQKLNKNRI